MVDSSSYWGLLIPFFRFALIQNIPLRGCISIGQFFQTNERILGPAVNEASQYYEKSNWIGIMTSPSAGIMLNSASEVSHQLLNTFVKYNVPISNEEEDDQAMETWSLQWTKEKTDYDKEIIDNEHIEQILLQRLNSSVGNAVNIKWRNTLDFYNQFALPTEQNF
jgi:hypothetical protein